MKKGILCTFILLLVCLFAACGTDEQPLYRMNGGAIWQLQENGKFQQCYNFADNPNLNAETAVLIGWNESGVYYNIEAVSGRLQFYVLRSGCTEPDELTVTFLQAEEAVLADRWLCCRAWGEDARCNQLLLYDTRAQQITHLLSMDSFAGTNCSCTGIRVDGEQLILAFADGSEWRFDPASGCIFQGSGAQSFEVLPQSEPDTGGWSIENHMLLLDGQPFYDLTKLGTYVHAEVIGADASTVYVALSAIRNAERGSIGYDTCSVKRTQPDSARLLKTDALASTPAFMLSGGQLCSFWITMNGFYLACQNQDGSNRRYLSDLSGVNANCTAWCTDGTYLYFGYENGALVRYDAASGCSYLIRQAQEGDGSVYAMGIRENTLAWRYALQTDGQIHILQLQSAQPAAALPGSAMQPDGYSLEEDCIFYNGSLRYDLSQLENYDWAELIGANASGVYFEVHFANLAPGENSRLFYVLAAGAAEPEQLPYYFQSLNGMPSSTWQLLVAGKWLIALRSGNGNLSCDQLVIYDTEKQRLLHANVSIALSEVTGTDAGLTATAWNGSLLALGFEDGTIFLLDLDTERSWQVAAGEDEIRQLSIDGENVYWRERTQEGDAIFSASTAPDSDRKQHDWSGTGWEESAS